MTRFGVIEKETGVNAGGLRSLKEQLMRFRGLRGEKTFGLDKGRKWMPSSPALNGKQLIETRHHQIEAIVRWFSVPLHKMIHLA
ncbi:MAG: hypothetical protein AB7O80_20615 [Acetobacteraceae bacterium]